MKKILLTLACILFLTTSSAQAKTFKVVSLQCFSTNFPLETFNIETLQRMNLGHGIIIEPGTVVAGKVVKIIKPRRGKRNAYFEFVPVAMRYNGVITRIEHPYITADIVGYRTIDPKDAAVYAAKKATNLIFIGASVGVSFVEGSIKAEEGDRLKSGLKQTYKDTPLSLIEPGSELNIEVGDTLKFKIRNNFNF